MAGGRLFLRDTTRGASRHPSGPVLQPGCETWLFQLDGRSRFLELRLDRVGLFLVHALLHRLRSRVDEVLGLLEAETGDGPDDLDHLDLGRLPLYRPVVCPTGDLSRCKARLRRPPALLRARPSLRALSRCQTPTRLTLRLPAPSPPPSPPPLLPAQRPAPPLLRPTARCERR